MSSSQGYEVCCQKKRQNQEDKEGNCLPIFTNHDKTGGEAITSVRLSVQMFPLYLSNQLTFGLDLLHMSGSLLTHRGQKLKVAGHGQNAVGLTSILDCGQFSS